MVAEAPLLETEAGLAVSSNIVLLGLFGSMLGLAAEWRIQTCRRAFDVEILIKDLPKYALHVLERKPIGVLGYSLLASLANSSTVVLLNPQEKDFDSF